MAVGYTFLFNCYSVLMKLSSRKVIIVNAIHALYNEQDKTNKVEFNSVSGVKKS